MKKMFQVEYKVLWNGKEISDPPRTREIVEKPGESHEKTLKKVAGLKGKYDVRILKEQFSGTMG